MTSVMFVVALCMATSVTVVLSAGRLLERSRPSTVVPLLAIGSLFSAASLGLLLALLGKAVASTLPEIASTAGWSIDRSAATLPVPVLVCVAAGCIAAVLLARTLWRAGRISVLLVKSDRLGRRLRAGGSPIVFVDSDEAQADAYTLAGIKGCVVISRQFFSALGPREQQMLTGHELSHLRRRHHLYIHAVDLAVAANPILTRVAPVIRLGVERWADEDAAAMMAGDRASAATALASTALTRASLRRGGEGAVTKGKGAVPVLAVATSHVAQRARALLSPAPQRSVLTVLVAALMTATCIATLATALHLHAGFEHAEIFQHITHQ